MLWRLMMLRWHRSSSRSHSRSQIMVSREARSVIPCRLQTGRLLRKVSALLATPPLVSIQPTLVVRRAVRVIASLVTKPNRLEASDRLEERTA
jgi:hypothetical protein